MNKLLSIAFCLMIIYASAQTDKIVYKSDAIKSKASTLPQITYITIDGHTIKFWCEPCESTSENKIKVFEIKKFIRDPDDPNMLIIATTDPSVAGIIIDKGKKEIQVLYNDRREFDYLNIITTAEMSDVK
ncbi:MAG: hypothetical protein IPN61_09180 [Bacteroidetes bacterium]|nr:hypothetical protein [Bacteroidota bacterium]